MLAPAMGLPVSPATTLPVTATVGMGSMAKSAVCSPPSCTSTLPSKGRNPVAVMLTPCVPDGTI